MSEDPAGNVDRHTFVAFLYDDEVTHKLKGHTELQAWSLMAAEARKL